MLHRVRESMKDENPPMLAGEIEAGEPFVAASISTLPTRMNAVARTSQFGGPATGKTTLFGIGAARGREAQEPRPRDGRPES
jgi:hypothetical protein